MLVESQGPGSVAYVSGTRTSQPQLSGWQVMLFWVFCVFTQFLYSSSRPPWLWWHPWRQQGIERLQEWKSFIFLSSEMSVLDLLPPRVPPWYNRPKTRSQPNSTLFLSSYQFVLALFPTSLLIRDNGTRVVELNLYFTEDILHFFLLHCRPCLP